MDKEKIYDTFEQDGIICDELVKQDFLEELCELDPAFVEAFNKM